MTIVKVYANGGCKTDDGRRWNAHGIEYGDTDQFAQNKLKWAQTAVQDRAKSVTDVAVLERALAVLKGDDKACYMK